MLSWALAWMIACLPQVSSAQGSLLDRSVVQGPLAPRDYWLFESGPVRPMALSVAGDRLYVANIPDGYVEVFAVNWLGLHWLGSVPVGMEPVALAVRPDDRQLWVVNHLSDSVSVIDVAGDVPVLVETLQVGDEPRDIVFAGPEFSRAFVTTAHRGQNHPLDPQSTTSSVGRADVWVFDATLAGTEAGRQPEKILTLFGDTPRALAASADGSKVFAAIFRSGNRTTTLPPVAISGFPKPPPVDSSDGVLQPTTGIIVKSFNNIWQDELGRDYNGVVALRLPDLDVFEIDALANPPVSAASIASVGTTLFNMAVNPVNGDVYVSNTDARNHVRFAGDSPRANSSVRGHLADHRITRIRGGEITHFDLNPHLDFSKANGSQKDRDRSLSSPMGLAISADGEQLFVAAFGSSKVAIFETADLDARFPEGADHHVELTGGGPAGLVLDEARRKLYVLTRFDNAVSIIDIDNREELTHIALHNPEPESVTRGRPLLYDARRTSGFGNESCATCHLFGDNDALAWDLGDPDGTVKNIPNRYEPLTANHPELGRTFHPLKGPMTTQSMRGLPRHGPQHWRGDRTGSVRSASETLEEAAFKEFNEAFDALAALGNTLPDEDMQAFSDFAMQLTYPPNPMRRLDNSLTPTQATGLNLFVNGVLRSDGNLEVCVTCHTLDPAAGFFGTTGLMAFNDQPGEKDFKIPHFRDQYQKVGMFTSIAQSPRNEVRGYAMNHNGATSINALFNEFGIATSLTNALKEFLFAFDAETAPVMGQQLTLSADSYQARESRLDLLMARARVTAPYPECDLVVRQQMGSQFRGWTFDRPSNQFLPDGAGDVLDEAAMRQTIAAATRPMTATCLPWGSGRRVGIDRDGDQVGNADEIAQGSNPADPDSRTFRATGGLWLNPDRPGSGFDLQHGGGQMAMTWFTYDDESNPTWYQAAAPAGPDWQAPLLRFTWDPVAGAAEGVVVGEVTIAFSDSRNARISWQIGEQQGSEDIQRFRFSAAPTGLSLTGLWFDPQEPGYGLTVDTQGAVRLMVIYFYDDQHTPRWVLVQQDNTLVSSSEAISVTGPCPWCAFEPAVETSGGTMTTAFSSRFNASADFAVFLHQLDSGLWQRDGVQLQRLSAEASLVPDF